MRVYITDIAIPLDHGQAMQASDAIEQAVGPCDTGAGFGWRDIEVQSPDEDDQKHVVVRAHMILKDFGYDVATNKSNAGRAYAHIRTRSVDPDEDSDKGE
jgi:hypothetical protein